MPKRYGVTWRGEQAGPAEWEAIFDLLDDDDTDPCPRNPRPESVTSEAHNRLETARSKQKKGQARWTCHELKALLGVTLKESPTSDR